MKLLSVFFMMLMNLCYEVIPNHWWDIVIFTLITKILQMPLSLWCHRNSLTMVSIMPEMNRLKAKYFGDSERIGEESARLFKEKHYHPLLSLIPLGLQIVILMGFVDVIYRIAGSEEGSLLAKIPVQDGGISWLMPIAAGLAAWFLGYCQNRINPLQREQTRTQQKVTNGISICISLFLGCFVGMGVGLYWVFSNLFSVLVQLSCNMIMRPSRYIDYKALCETKAELEKIEALGKIEVSKEDLRREKNDYKRFFKVANKHLVFYSESSGFYKYFKNTIEWILSHTNMAIHYVTNDPADQIFEKAKSNPRIKPYYIGPMKIIPLMMKMDADMVVMTTPDIDRFHIKKSYVRKDIEYVYMPHGMASMHMVVREHAYDNYDTVLCAGQHQADELRAMEKLYGSKPKNLPLCGYGLMDDLLASYAESAEKPRKMKKTILIAPSYQADNIMDSCLDDLLSALEPLGCKIVVRPHPQYKKRYSARLESIVEKYKGKRESDLVFETDFSSNTNILDADLLICDWSGIIYEYAFTTLRPVLCVNTPMKVINKNYQAVGLPVQDIELRKKVGESIELNEIPGCTQRVQNLLREGCVWRERIAEIRNRTVANLGGFGAASGKYIVTRLMDRQNKTK